VVDLAAVLAGPVEPGTVAIDWQPPADGGPARSYRVDWLDPSGVWVTVSAGPSLAAEHACGVPLVTCTYRVVAENPGGAGPPVPVSVVTQGPPAAPPGLSWSTILGSRSVRLTWSAPNDGGLPVLRYHVRRTSDLQSGGPAPDATWTTFTTSATTLGTTCSVTSYGINRCIFQVRAENALGHGPWSPGVLASTFVPPPTEPKP
jgi:hypothetical protein